MSNLLNKKTLAQLFPDENHEQLYSKLKIFTDLGVNRDFFNINDNGSITIHSSDSAENFSIETIFRVASQLINLKSFDNFASFSEGFNNPSQFSATIFEVDCANFALNNLKIKDICFEPEVSVNGGIKRPDFAVIFFDNSSIICECKSLYSINRAKRSKALKLMQTLENKLQEILNSNFRVEISFKWLPTHWNRNYTDQLFGAVSTLIKKEFTAQHINLNIDNKHTTWIKLNRINEPIFFKNTLNVGNKPKGNNPTLVVGEVPNITKDIKDTIRDARTQIPEESNSVIFLYSLNEHYAERAIKEFYKDNSPNNLLSIVSWTNNLKIHRNFTCPANIFDYLNQ